MSGLPQLEIVCPGGESNPRGMIREFTIIAVVRAKRISILIQ